MKGANQALATVDGQKRYDYIVSVLQREQSRSRTWNVAWTLLATAGTGASYLGAQLGDDLFDDPEKAENFEAAQYVSVVKASIGVVTFALLPLKIPQINYGQVSGLATCKQVAVAENLLRTAAKKQRLKRLLDHLSVVVINAASFLYLYLERDDLSGAILNTISGAAFGELKAWTSPMGAIDALNAYKRGDITSQAAPPRWGLFPHPVPNGGAISLVRSF